MEKIHRYRRVFQAYHTFKLSFSNIVEEALQTLVLLIFSHPDKIIDIASVDDERSSSNPKRISDSMSVNSDKKKFQYYFSCLNTRIAILLL